MATTGVGWSAATDSAVKEFVTGLAIALRVDVGPKGSRRAAASNVHVAGGAIGAAGALPAKGLTKELTTRDITTAIELAGFCGAVAVGTAGCCRTVAGAFDSGVIRAVPDGGVAADVGTAFAWMQGASTVPAATIRRGRTDGFSAAGESNVAVDTAAGWVALAKGPNEEAGFDRLRCLDGVEVCESAACGCDTGALGTAVGEDVCEAKEPRPLGRDVLLEAPGVENEPVFGPPVLTTMPGAGCEFVSVDVDPVLDGEVDGAPSVDVDELVDDGSEPDGADGSADATP
jgi:hypothetical protein